MSNHIDFDQLWAEADAARNAPTITVRGETFDLPRDQPAKVFVIRARYADVDDITLDIMSEMLEPYVGRDRVDRWIEAGMTIPQLFDLATRIGTVYQRQEPDEGEAPAPAEGASQSASSSPDGDTSRATSEPTTASDSPPPSMTAA